MTIKIPSDSKIFSQTNKSDFDGNVWASRNLNFREKGYMKLSSRAVSIYSQETDVSSQFRLPIDFFGSNDQYTTVTANKPMNFNISEAAFTSVDNTVYGTAPTTSLNSRGVLWNGNFYITTDTAIWYSSGNNTWTQMGAIVLQSGNVHAVEVFKTLGYLAIADGSSVYLYDMSFTLKLTVSIPSNYKITHLKYSNGRLAIIGRSSDEGIMFLTDGTSTVYDSAIPLGSDMAVGIVSYRNSWAVLNRRGQLLFFNGGSFEEISRMPYYPKNYLFGDYGTLYAIGNSMYVEGDQIFINVPTFLNVFGEDNQQYMDNYPGGIWCYDPTVGLYHRYAPSQSPIQQLSVTSSGVNTTTNTLTSLQSIVTDTGNPIKYTSDKTTPIGGLTPGQVYYIINLDDISFRLALTYADAIAGNAVDLTSTGAATNQFLSLNLVDYGVSYTSGIQGGVTMPSTHTLTHDHLVFGTQQYDIDSPNVYGHLDLTVSGFKNIGYFITPKLYSQNVTDKYQKVYVKYRPISSDDSLTLKVKQKEVLGLPVSSTFGLQLCTWTSSSAFITTKDFSAVLDAYNLSIPMECDIIGGAGAGQLSQVSSVTFLAGVYTIVLADTIEGASAGRNCDALIDNWTAIPATNGDGTYSEYSVQSSSTWHKYKLILSGYEIAIEEMQFINATQLPSKN